MTIPLSTTVLSGVSTTAPGIDGNSLFGFFAVWADGQQPHYVTSAWSGNSYQPAVLNSAWTAVDTPGVALAYDWETLFVAFTDFDGFVQLASSADGWMETQTISQAGVKAGPALAYNDILYIAWQAEDGTLGFATCDRDGNITDLPGGVPLTSRPTICVDDANRIYVLCGGTLKGGPNPIMIYLSVDGGNTFTSVTTPQTLCFGPPSLVMLDQFYLAWADGQTSNLRLAQTADLGSYTPMVYDMGCHEGGPGIIPVATIKDPTNPSTWVFSLTAGWTVGSSDSNSHHVAVGSFSPLPVGGAKQVEKQRRMIARVAAPRAKDPCPDPLTVYDPATGKCVARGGCWGQCVLSSFTSVWGAGSVFNPIAYAACVIKCKIGQT